VARILGCTWQENTLVVQYYIGKVIEVDIFGDIVIEMTGFNGPVDAERLDNGNTLIAEFYANRIIEVNNDGVIVEELSVCSPLDTERLTGGNTVIAEYGPCWDVVELDSNGTQIWEKTGISSPYDVERLPPPVIEVTIDIKPGSYPNSINLGSNGNVPVAIFSTEDFDATTVDPLTIRLSGAEVRLKGKGDPQVNFDDVDGDGLEDIIVHVDTQTFSLTGDDTEAILTGETFDGQKIRGVDTVRIVNE